MDATVDSACSDTTADAGVDFLWLELTNRCNLRCVHCYAESGPSEYGSDVLTGDDYERLLDEGRDLGCRDVQFIGGEPTLNRDLPRFIGHARRVGYGSVEVFSNLTYLPDPLLQCFRDHAVSVATSFYSGQREVHDDITQRRGSFDRTVHNLRRVLEAQLTTRAGIIEMEQNAGQTAETMDYLHALGVQQVGVDRVRKFGRANGEEGGETVTELCGNCAGQTLCVGPDGTVSPCIMSKAWSIGSVLEEGLPALAHSERLREIRSTIHAEVVAPRERQEEQRRAANGTAGTIVACGPCEPVCTPCNPWCSPGQSCNPCNPKGSEPCYPNGRCTPR